MGLNVLILTEYIGFFKVQTLPDLHAHSILFEEAGRKCPIVSGGGYGPVRVGSGDALKDFRASPYPTCKLGMQCGMKTFGSCEQTAEDVQAQLEKARLAVQTACRTPAGNLRKKPEPLTIGKTYGDLHSIYAFDEIRKTLTHVSSLQPNTQMGYLKRAWEWNDVKKDLEEQERPLILSNEHTAAAADLLKKFPKCTPYDYNGGHADSHWSWFNAKTVKDEISGTERVDMSDEIEVLARVILYFQEIEKIKKGRTIIRDSRIRCLRNGIRKEDHHLSACKATGHIWRKVFRADDSFRGRIDDGHIVLAGLHLGYLSLKRVEQGDGREFDGRTPCLRFDKIINRFKGWT